MSRCKKLVLFLILVVTLLWPLPTAAQDPNPDPSTCLPICYVSNIVIPGTTTPRDGTKEAPWLAPTAEDRLAVRSLVAAAVRDTGNPATLKLIICDSAQQCAYTVYEYDENGQATAGEPNPGIPPEVGIPLPLPYILVAGVILGVLLVGGGVLLWHRAQRLSSKPSYSGAQLRS